MTKHCSSNRETIKITKYLFLKHQHSSMILVPPLSLCVHIYIYILNVVLNKSSQEPPFRNSFANLSPAFAVPKGLHFPKSRIRIRNQIYGIKQIRLQTLQ